MDSTRLQKVTRLLQKELSEIFQKEAKLFGGAMISVTTVRLTNDLSLARVYLSIFDPHSLGSQGAQNIIDVIKNQSWKIKQSLAAKIRNQMRKIPDLEFFIDDSLDYAQKIDDLLK